MQNKGFTLIEILVALFISTILLMILSSALHQVISTQSHLDKQERTFKQLQLALMILSHRIEFAVDMIPSHSDAEKNRAFTGSAQAFSFMTFDHHTLMRERFYVDKHTLWVVSFQDTQTFDDKIHPRLLLNQVDAAHFEYLGESKQFYDHWPVNQEPNQDLPKAVRITLSLHGLGNLSQIYVIPNANQKGV